MKTCTNPSRLIEADILEAIFIGDFDKAKALIKKELASTGGAIPLVDVFARLFENYRYNFTRYPEEDSLKPTAYPPAYREIIDLLLEAKADLEAQSSLGETALALAIKLDDESLVQSLLEKGANPHYVSKGGDTALHIANNSAKLLYPRKPNINIISMLLDAKVKPGQANQQGEAALTVALRDNKRTEKIINIQIPAYNKSRIQLFHQTVFNETSLNNPDLINIILLYASICLTSFESTPLKDQQAVYKAMMENDLAALERLIRQGINIDDLRGLYEARRNESYTPLQYAAQERKLSVEGMKMLLNNNGRSQDLGIEADEVAAGLEALFEGFNGRVLFEERQSALELFPLFINHPAINLNFQGKGGRTALMQAIKLVWDASDAGYISTSSEEEINPVVDWLLDRKIKPDLDRQDDWGNTAMMLAAKSLGSGPSRDYCYHLIEQLIKNKANVNIQNQWGDTALTILTAKRYTKGVELLLENKANPALCGKNGKSAFTIAANNQMEEIANLLRRYASESSSPADEKRQGTLEKVQGSHGSVINMLCKASERSGSAILAENSENPSKTHHASKKVYDTGENKPQTNQRVEPLAGSAGSASTPTNSLSLNSVFQNGKSKKNDKAPSNKLNVSGKPSSPSTP